MGKHRGFGLLACCALAFVLAARSIPAHAQSEPALAPQDPAAGVSAAPVANATPAATPAAAPAAAAPPAPAVRVPPWRAGAVVQARDSETPAAADSGTTALGAGHNTRAQNSWFGSTGGLHLIDGSSGPVGTGRLQLGFDYFSASNLFSPGDSNQGLSGVLSLSMTPLEQLEVFAALSSHSNTNSRGNPQLLQVAGDVLLGAKGYKQLLPWLSLGADARLLFLNTVGDLGVLLAGTSLGVRGAATADLRYMQQVVPLILRANLGYLLDNSSALVESVENARYAALPVATRRDMASEDRHLVTRIERFALGVNRLDMLTIGIGAEAPLTVMRDFYVHPLLEWQLGIPVNRQGYSCLSLPAAATVDGVDGCLAITGLSAAPSTLTFGARVMPPVRGLAALLAFDVSLMGAGTFVRELASNRPWAFMLSVAYAVDTRIPAQHVRYVVGRPRAPVVAPAATNKKRIRGQVIERGFGTAIVGATVRYADHDVNPQLTDASGRFVSYEFPPGQVVLDVSHPDYEPARCAASIPAAAASVRRKPAATAAATHSRSPAPAVSGLALVPAGGGTAAVSSKAPAVDAGNFVEVRCELVGKPKVSGVQGSLVNETGTPVAGGTIDLTGPDVRSAVSDAGGQFAAQGLQAGEYVARVDAANFLLKSQPFTLTAGSDSTLHIVLVAKPKTSQVTMTAHEVKIRQQIMFKSNSADIDDRSTALLSEIADVLQRNPQAAHVQVQGHTDNRGDPAANLALSQQRAEAVVQWLVNAGVVAARLEPKGFGDQRPLVPNLTPGNRSQNRRVQFIIKE
jgi:OOP family OmpA-OmpF porin